MSNAFFALGRTDVGLVREENEDAFLLLDGAELGGPPLHLRGCVAVADGMGGHAYGALASNTALDAVSESIRQPGDWPSLSSLMRHVVAMANERVFELSDPQAHRRPATTLTMLAINDSDFVVAHVGDSRAYLCRGGHIRRLTLDHTKVAEALAEGVISERIAAVSPLRHVLSRAVGNEPITEPQLVVGEWQQNDLFLLCSDGLTEHVSDEELQRFAQDWGDRDLMAMALIETANERGGSDNVTVVIVECFGEPEAKGLTPGARRQKTDTFENPLG
jgi:protein phosphatase